VYRHLCVQPSACIAICVYRENTRRENEEENKREKECARSREKQTVCVYSACERKRVLDAEMLQNGEIQDARWCVKIQDATCNMQNATCNMQDAAHSQSTRLKNSADTHRRTPTEYSANA